MKKESVMANMAQLNTLWDGSPLRIDRKTAGSYTVKGVRLTLGLAVQADTIKAFLDGPGGLARGIGFLARFLIAWPDSTQGNRPFKEPPVSWPCLSKFQERILSLLNTPLPFNDNGELSPCMFRLSPEAKAVWVAFHDDVETELKPGREMAEVKDVASKAADNAARVAALFHLFEGWTSFNISADHMRRAASIVSWHLYEARRFMGEVSIADEVKNAVVLESWLIARCHNEGVTEIRKNAILQNCPNRMRNAATINKAIKELTEAGRVRLVTIDGAAWVQVRPELLR